ncbi:transglycosylase SLT domain-containing protein [Cupriavidus basilensis]|uniref:transglycosylase SLT domain-containing protein n=1 Tax=Cupriavidus basilensis TaxID=68895 RepID=UPI000750D4D1|nr:transglycosylase SLT domain-containing protein [Cupriavidus basilensis]
MPRVPTYDSPQVQPQGLPGARVEAAPVQLAVNAANDQAAQLNRATSQLADTTFNIGLDMQRQANALRVDDALNQAREATMRLTFDKTDGYTNIKGRDVFERPSGQMLSDEYDAALTNSFANISAGLGNDAQRQAFQQRANDMATQFRGQVMQHENRENAIYAQSVGEGIIATRQREIGLNYNNPALVDDAVTSIRAQAYNIAKLTGKSAEWAETQARVAASNAHLIALGAALENNNPVYADAYLKKYAKDMDANDILRANGLITKQLDAQIGTATGAAVMAKAMPSLQPTDAARLTNLVMGAESRGRDFDASGKLLTSPKGAMGRMQVMPDTARDPGYGIAPAKDNSPDELARVGTEKLAAMLKRYQGNVGQALAAYNWGEKNVDKAIAQSDAARKEAPLADERYRSALQYANKMVDAYNKAPTPDGAKAVAAAKAEADALGAKAKAAAQGTDWLAGTPAETQKYVGGILKAYSAGAGAPQKPTEAELKAQVRATIPEWQTDRIKAAENVISKQFTEYQQATRQREDETVAAAQSALIANGGQFSDLPLAIRSKLPPGKYDDVMGFADRIAKGQAPQTDWSLYYTLKNDPAVLGGVNLMALRDKLADSEFKQLTNEQQDVRQGKTQDTTNLRTGRDYLNQFMREAGIDPTPKDDDKAGAAVVGRIWNSFEQRVRAQETNLGRKLRPEEMKQEAAALFTAVEVNHTFWNKTLPAAAVAPDQALVVPDRDRDQITQALRAAGKPVTDQAIQDLYRRAKGVLPLKTNG